MNAHSIASRIATEYETCTGNSYVLTEADVFDGKNRLGMNVAHLPLGVPLCGGCDTKLDHGYCSSCELVHLDVSEPCAVWL